LFSARFARDSRFRSFPLSEYLTRHSQHKPQPVTLLTRLVSSDRPRSEHLCCLAPPLPLSLQGRGSKVRVKLGCRVPRHFLLASPASLRERSRRQARVRAVQRHLPLTKSHLLHSPIQKNFLRNTPPISHFVAVIKVLYCARVFLIAAQFVPDRIVVGFCSLLDPQTQQTLMPRE
jgi:hypothetical protein